MRVLGKHRRDKPARAWLVPLSPTHLLLIRYRSDRRRDPAWWRRRVSKRYLRPHALITFVNQATVANPGSVASFSITHSTSSGNCVVVVIAIRTPSSTVSTIIDSGGSIYTIQAAINNGTVARVEVWSTSPIGSKASTSLTVTLAAASKVIGCSAQYSGVAALGVTNTATSGVANPSIAITTQDVNNFVVAGFASQGTGAFTAGTGNLRDNAASSGGGASSNVGGAQVDNTAASPSSVSCSVTDADTAWALAALELRSVDLMPTIIM